ncbi:MAG: adenine deaminase [Phycisphaerales bacterium]|nr:MAG: adenine deaminase [Phycisphaerales bacterium]
MELQKVIDVAAGREPADLVLKGGHIVNVLSDEVYEADVAIAGDRIAAIGSYDGHEVVDLAGRYVCPGFIDGHVHIESSMLSVYEFARVVVARGTTAVVADPHEIANVMGTEGIRFILSSSKYCPIHVYLTLSSCVPASQWESSGAELTAVDLLPLLSDSWVLGLAEVMNFKGVVANDEVILDKLKVAADRVIDGHAPGLTGPALNAYVASGIHSDHECTTVDEAREKLRLGMHVMIREGSAARDLDALLPLVSPGTVDRFLFVTDDKDVDDLMEEGHIDHMVRRAVKSGIKPSHAVKMSSFNTARYFGLRGLGAVAPGYQATITVLDDFDACRVARVYQSGRLVAADGVCVDPDNKLRRTPILRSAINVQWLEPTQFIVQASGAGPCNVHVIEVVGGQINTGRSVEEMPVVDGTIQADPSRDLAKVAVIERHQASGNIGLGFVRGFGLASGAIASSVAHDSHNIVVVGTNDRDMFEAAVHLVKIRGGLCVVRDGTVLADVPLPIAGLMSALPAEELSRKLKTLHTAAAGLDCRLRRPFMAMSFLSLSVIGALRVTDQGLLDVEKFRTIDLLAK